MLCFFFVKQKTAYEVRISDWSSDVCSSDLDAAGGTNALAEAITDFADAILQPPFPEAVQLMLEFLGGMVDLTRLLAQNFADLVAAAKALASGDRKSVV